MEHVACGAYPAVRCQHPSKLQCVHKVCSNLLRVGAFPSVSSTIPRLGLACIAWLWIIEFPVQLLVVRIA